jgi:CRISPR-associated endoribonuclease Cas6
VRVRLVFSLKNRGGWVPFHHQHLLAQFIKDLANKDISFKNFKLYNFSGLKGQTKISRQGLHFYSNKVTLVVSSYEPKFINHLLQQIFNQPEVQIGDLSLIPESVEKENSPEIDDHVKYVCISPLVLTEPEKDNYHAKKFIPPEDDEFSDLLYDSTMMRMEQSGLFTTEQIASFFKFQIVPDKIYLKKIKEDHKKFARIYTIPQDRMKLEVRGYTLPFELYAAPEVQQFVFECGLGAYTHQGYGMIDLANTDPIKRTVIYFPEPLENS